MILADSSVWIDHLGRGDPVLQALLDDDRVAMHPFVMGEIALGSLRDRQRVLFRLRRMPQAPVARTDTIVPFIDHHALSGAGIGYVDAHLLASALLAPGTRMWTRDKRLHTAAERLGVAAKPVN